MGNITEIDGKALHVPDEKLDCRPAFQREAFFSGDEGHNLYQQRR